LSPVRWLQRAETCQCDGRTFHLQIDTRPGVQKLEPGGEAFTPWVKHRHSYEDFPAPLGEPMDQETILEYLPFCQEEVRKQVPRLKLEELEGHGDRSMITLELQIYSIRHIMQHAGELMERLGSRTGAQIDWVGSYHPGVDQ
jgi:hypothetical protein